MQQQLNERIIKLAREVWGKKFAEKKFVPGESYIPVSGKVFNEQELISGMHAVLEGWWTEGKYGTEFERQFGKFLGVRYVSLVNSGSSANLVALSALTSKVFGKQAIKPGDEIITAATGFSTTVNPIIQNRCKVVFVDSDLATKNPSLSSIAGAITPKTRAIMMAHTLGNPLPLEGILKLVKKYNLWLIEDCCDALGSTYQGKLVGNLGHIATYSFYPAHQITMGEGGAIVTNNPLMHMAIRQFRDWGRDCWCGTGEDNICRRRFGWQLGELPFGYDHKYIYSQIGYNLKLTDMQAAIGLAQLAKLPNFIKIRKQNFQLLLRGLNKYSKYFIFSQAEQNSDPCWFGFMMVLKDKLPFTKLELIKYLEERKIATRGLFGGNLARQPAYLNRDDIKIVGSIKNSDIIMNNGFWIGIYPGITGEMIKYMVEAIGEFIKKRAS